jgi:brefeldin A-resistance guanine nucleotide exchange factor 1
MLKVCLETLRRSAETTMHTLVRVVFSKLHELDPVEEETKLQAAPTDEENEGELRMSVIPAKESEETSSLNADPEQTEKSESTDQHHIEETLLSPTNRPECMLPYVTFVFLDLCCVY